MLWQRCAALSAGVHCLKLYIKNLLTEQLSSTRLLKLCCIHNEDSCLAVRPDCETESVAVIAVSEDAIKKRKLR